MNVALQKKRSSTAHTDFSGRTEFLTGYGRAIGGRCREFSPQSADQVHDVLLHARQEGLSIGGRGAGRSYGDAAVNSDQAVLNLSRLNRIIEFDRDTGSVTVEPGTTIDQLWRHCLPSGWWPHVVTGTSRTTLGGCAAMNTHGKNMWQAGPIGEYISSLSLLTPSGDTVNCSSTDNGELFRAAIGGFGMLGIITRLTLQLRSVSSGLVAVNEYAEKNLAATFDRFESAAGGSDFMVAWLDAFARGSRLGRGHIQCAAHVEESEPGSLSVANQELPTRVAGLLPKTWIRHLLQPCWNDTGVRWINEARYRAARVRHGRQSRLPVVWYQFLLDSVPGFERCFGRSGLIQHQVLVPDAHAYDVFEQLIRLQQRKGLVNYLTVMKKHRTDGFLMSYGVDGYSLAQDFRVTRNNRSRLWELCHQMDELVASAGGRFYLAKDATLLPQHYRASMPPESLEEFFRLKRQLDPDELLQTDLWRRLLRPLRG